jgi:hypothetical protein
MLFSFLFINVLLIDFSGNNKYLKEKIWDNKYLYNSSKFSIMVNRID